MTPESPQEPDSLTILRKEKLAKTVLWNLRKQIFNVTYRSNDVEQAKTFCDYDSAGNRRRCRFPNEDEILKLVTVEEKTYAPGEEITLTLSLRIPFEGSSEWAEYWMKLQSYDDPVPEHPFTGPGPRDADRDPCQTGVAYLDEVLRARKENEKLTAFAKNVAVYIAIAAATVGGIYGVMKGQGRIGGNDVAQPAKAPLRQRTFPKDISPIVTARPSTSPLSIPGSDPTRLLAEDDPLSLQETRVRTFSLLPSQESPGPRSRTDLPR